LLRQGNASSLHQGSRDQPRVQSIDNFTLSNESIVQQSGDSSKGEGMQSDRAAAIDEPSRIVLVPRDCKHAYAYWEIAEADRAVAKRQGGRNLVLRVYEASETNLDIIPAHSVQQYQCEEDSQDRHVSIPLSERVYVAEVGYITADGRWLSIARSLQVRISELQPIL
jgi:phosphate transport system substrate-binding protein